MLHTYTYTHTHTHTYTHTHHVSENTVQNCLCQNFIKFPSILIIYGRKITKWLKLYAIYTFSTSLMSSHYLVKHKSSKFYSFSGKNKKFYPAITLSYFHQFNNFW